MYSEGVCSKKHFLNPNINCVTFLDTSIWLKINPLELGDFDDKFVHDTLTEEIFFLNFLAILKRLPRNCWTLFKKCFFGSA